MTGVETNIEDFDIWRLARFLALYQKGQIALRVTDSWGLEAFIIKIVMNSTLASQTQKEIAEALKEYFSTEPGMVKSFRKLWPKEPAKESGFFHQVAQVRQSLIREQAGK